MHVFNNSESIDIAQTVSDIIMQDEKLRPSKLWEEYDMPVCPDRLRLSDLIPRTINIYKSKIVEQMIAQIQSRLDSPELSEEEIVGLIDRIKLLNESRVYFCQKYTRIII
jgi:DNA primase